MTDTRSFADLRSRMAELWQRANDSAPRKEWPQVTRLTDAPALAKVPEGFTAWSVGPWSDDPDTSPAARHVVLLPTLGADAPISVRRRLLARAVALGTGRCPMCSAVVGLSQEPPMVGRQGIAAWRVLPVYVRISHAVGCPAYDFTDDDRRYFLPPTGTAEPSPEVPE